MTLEFSRPLSVDRIGAAGPDITIEASGAECAAVAARLQLPAIRTLTCRFRLRPTPGGVFAAEGWLSALITQTCVVSLDDFDAAMTEHFSLRFVPAGSETPEIDPETEDEIPFTNNIIDLGEAATEQLALSLDPWPRKPGAGLPGTKATEDTSAFGILAARRRPS
jgi:Large ribosomal RNA subunit accumulation protein YceD